jgi:hypothetical protein
MHGDTNVKKEYTVFYIWIGRLEGKVHLWLLGIDGTIIPKLTLENA